MCSFRVAYIECFCIYVYFYTLFPLICDSQFWGTTYFFTLIVWFVVFYLESQQRRFQFRLHDHCWLPKISITFGVSRWTNTKQNHLLGGIRFRRLGGPPHQTKPLGVINMRKNWQNIQLVPVCFVVQKYNLEVVNLHYLIIINCKLRWYLNEQENINAGKWRYFMTVKKSEVIRNEMEAKKVYDL